MCTAELAPPDLWIGFSSLSAAAAAAVAEEEEARREPYLECPQS